VFELRRRIAPENALAHHGLAEAVDTLYDLFVVPINLGVKRIDLAIDGIDFAVQRLDVLTKFAQQAKGMVLGLGHRVFLIGCKQT